MLEKLEIPSCDDDELGIKRDSKLEFKIYYDELKPPKALVFIIQGFGADMNSVQYVGEYSFRKFGVCAVSVNYHCIGNRPQTGSSFYLDDKDKAILKEQCKRAKIKLPYEDISDFNQMCEIFNFINQNILERKLRGLLEPDYTLSLHVSLQPTKNEYQNFGLMQARDILNAALYLKARFLKENFTGGGVTPYFNRQFARRLFSSSLCENCALVSRGRHR